MQKTHELRTNLREAHLQLKMYKIPQNGKSLRREADLQVKTLKNWQSRATLAVRMWKNGTRLWHEAHLQLKMIKQQGKMPKNADR